jgi:uncharacterized membrane protein
MTRAPRILGTAARILATLFAVAIALYAVAYLIRREQMFPPPLVASFRARPWGIYPHALFGSIALALGSVQFWRNFPYSHPALHRTLGKIYVVAVMGTGAAGLYMSFFSFGGAITHAGFGLLALSVLTTTVIAYLQIRRRNVPVHREWMLRSFALIFAAVTLRIELPLLITVFHAFGPAYSIVSWLCWVPNLAIAEIYVRTSHSGSRASFPLQA